MVYFLIESCATVISPLDGATVKIQNPKAGGFRIIDYFSNISLLLF